MKVAVLDDYQNVAVQIADWSGVRRVLDSIHWVRSSEVPYCSGRPDPHADRPDLLSIPGPVRGLAHSANL
jgi:hypothetical protein